MKDLDRAVSPDGPSRAGQAARSRVTAKRHRVVSRRTKQTDEPIARPAPRTEQGRHETLIAADELGIAGVARLIRDEGASSTAEDAIIIADDRQHQRVARLMLDRLKLR